MIVELTGEQRDVIVDALKRRLISVRADYQDAVEIGDPASKALRHRRDLILALIEGLERQEA